MSRLAVVALVLAGCAKAAPESAPAAVEAAGKEPPKIVVSKDRADLVFTYVDAAGQFHDATTIAEVPEVSRAQVLVRDLSKSPDELRTTELLYVADLRAPDDKGRYACGAVSRRAFDRGGADEAAVQAASAGLPESEQGVVVYSASWCGVCRAAKAWLAQRHVAFVEKDVEKLPGAEAELRAKARRAGVSPQGVPVIDVAGELLVGFDEDALAAALATKGLAGASQGH